MANAESTPVVEGHGATQRRYVRVLERHANGLVKFEFAVGWPDLACELVLPQALFDGFCAQHNVEFMTTEQAAEANRHLGDSDDDQH